MSRSRGGPGSVPKRARTPAALAALTVLALAVAGCGIRPTSVPVDAGAAPSRVGCALPDERGSATVPESSVVRLYLVCSSRVVPVQRVVRLPEERTDIARTLLAELQSRPGPDEKAAGFTTTLPPELRIRDGGKGDPKEALRLSIPLDELPSYAVAQIVCTYTSTVVAAADGSIVLGGPADGAAKPLQRFDCGTALRTSPEAAETAGLPV